MQMRALFLTQLLVITALGILHVSALYYSLYWQYVWLDTVSHFLGGLWIALAYTWIMVRFGGTAPLLKVVSAALLIGVAWEVFEVVAGIPREANWLFDTTLDLLMDTIGGTVGAFVAAYLKRYE